jgi:hypothetical protein
VTLCDFFVLQVMQVSKTSRPSLITIAKTRKQIFFGKLALTKQQQSDDDCAAGAKMAARSDSQGFSKYANHNGGMAGGDTDTVRNFDDYYTFQGFASFMKFPSNSSPLMQERAYWLASQWSFEWKTYAKDFLPPKDLHASLLVSNNEDVHITRCQPSVGHPFCIYPFVYILLYMTNLYLLISYIATVNMAGIRVCKIS